MLDRAGRIRVSIGKEMPLPPALVEKLAATGEAHVSGVVGTQLHRLQFVSAPIGFDGACSGQSGQTIAQHRDDEKDAHDDPVLQLVENKAVRPVPAIVEGHGAGQCGDRR